MAHTYIALSFSITLIRQKQTYMIHITYNGSQSSSAIRVSSGLDVGFLTHPSLFTILWTCVSTPIPLITSHALFITKWAILGPTPVSKYTYNTYYIVLNYEKINHRFASVQQQNTHQLCVHLSTKFKHKCSSPRPVVIYYHINWDQIKEKSVDIN